MMALPSDSSECDTKHSSETEVPESTKAPSENGASETKKLKKKIASLRQRLQSTEALCSYQETQINKISETLTAMSWTCADPGTLANKENVADGVEMLSSKFRGLQMSIKAYKVELGPMRRMLWEQGKKVENLTAALKAAQCGSSAQNPQMLKKMDKLKTRERELYQRLDKERYENQMMRKYLSAALEQLELFKKGGSLNIVQDADLPDLPEESKGRTTTKRSRLPPPEKGEYVIKEAIGYWHSRETRICEVGRIKIVGESQVEIVEETTRKKVIQHQLPALCSSDLISSCQDNLSVRWLCSEMDAMQLRSGFMLRVFFRRKLDFFTFRNEVFKRPIARSSSQSV